MKNIAFSRREKKREREKNSRLGERKEDERYRISPLFTLSGGAKKRNYDLAIVSVIARCRRESRNLSRAITMHARRYSQSSYADNSVYRIWPDVIFASFRNVHDSSWDVSWAWNLLNGFSTPVCEPAQPLHAYILRVRACTRHAMDTMCLRVAINCCSTWSTFARDSIIPDIESYISDKNKYIRRGH